MFFLRAAWRIAYNIRGVHKMLRCYTHSVALQLILM